ncbi:MAG TPA: hypothetical protein VMT56_00735 [Candidatus Bathyarchaeia archaeon]|nr:hypothetical protein [Candidatus Bathyarchaeia archaeon]
MKIRRIKTLLMATMIVAVVVVAVVVVTPIVRNRNQNVALAREWAGLLKKYPAFSGRLPGSSAEVYFQYAASTDKDLRKLRDTYNLDTVAGQGSEADRIVNLTRWVFQLTGHANNPQIPKDLNALHLIHLAQVEHVQINCYMKTIILNEVFLAMGFPSRQTHLLPHSNEEEESHFITSVYSLTLGKWILMDPDFGVYVTDEKGNILGVAEIRSRLVAGEPLLVKDLVNTGRNTFAEAWANLRDFIDGTNYLWYLRKNVFKVQCPQVSMFDQRSKPNKVYIELLPDGYREELLQEPKITERGKTVYINDEGLFWQKPPGSGITS